MKSKGSRLKKITIKSGIDVKETENKEREKKRTSRIQVQECKLAHIFWRTIHNTQ